MTELDKIKQELGISDELANRLIDYMDISILNNYDLTEGKITETIVQIDEKIKSILV
jgi:hypothetical protein